MARGSDDTYLFLALAVAAGAALWYYSPQSFTSDSSGDESSDDGLDPPPDMYTTPVDPDASPDDEMVDTVTSTSAQGRAMIKSFEGFSATAYPDYQGYSIGYGHQIVPGDGLNTSSVITRAQGDALFDADITKYEQAVTDNITTAVNQPQFDALVDFTYNVGIGNTKKAGAGFLGSTLRSLINEGDFDAATGEFAKWNKAGGKSNASLVARRAAETNLFVNGVYP